MPRARCVKWRNFRFATAAAWLSRQSMSSLPAFRPRAGPMRGARRICVLSRGGVGLLTIGRRGQAVLGGDAGRQYGAVHHTAVLLADPVPFISHAEPFQEPEYRRIHSTKI